MDEMNQKKILSAIIILLSVMFQTSAQVVGLLKIEGPNGLINLPVVTEQDAMNAGHGVVKVALGDGLTGAASLVPITDPDASSVRIRTPYGTRAWKKLDFNLFSRAYGGSYQEVGNRVALSDDGTIAFAGYTATFGSGALDMLFLKLSETGAVQWGNAYGYSNNDYLYGMCPASDGGFILSGRTYSGGGGSGDEDRKKIDGSGNLVWEYWAGTSGYEGSVDVFVNPDGTIVLCNYTNGFGAGDYDAWIRKVDASGGTIWGYSYGGADYDYGSAIVRNNLGGYAVAGATESSGAGGMDIFFFTLDGSGTIVFNKVIGGAGDDVGRDLIQDSDGNYVIAGYTTSFGNGGKDFYIKKLDASGNSIWGWAFGGADDDDAYAIIQTADGGYAVAGTTESLGGGYKDIWLVKYGNDGLSSWDVSFGGSSNDMGSDLKQGPDGSFYVVGTSYSASAGSSDFIIVKISIDGNTCLVMNKDGSFGGPDGQFQVHRNIGLQLIGTENDPAVTDFKITRSQEKNIKSGSITPDYVTPVTPTVTTICD